MPMANHSDSLHEYRQRRSFSTSPEPSGHKHHESLQPIFVVQKHRATRLHYDFRIEVNGVLVSWAVPKGPTDELGVKRLAVMTEDHPLEYAHFEGVIPPGNYGAGTVRIWDSGTYQNIRTRNGRPIPMEGCIHDGLIELWMHGKRMKGGYALVRLARDTGKYWLLVKMDDSKIAVPENHNV